MIMSRYMAQGNYVCENISTRFEIIRKPNETFAIGRRVDLSLIYEAVDDCS